MRDGLHTFLRWIPWDRDGFHIVFTFFISPDLEPYGRSSFETLVN